MSDDEIYRDVERAEVGPNPVCGTGSEVLGSFSQPEESDVPCETPATSMSWPLTRFETDAGRSARLPQIMSLTISSSIPTVSINISQAVLITFDTDHIERLYWNREEKRMVMIRHFELGQKPGWIDIRFPTLGSLVSCSAVFEGSRVQVLADRPKKILNRAITRCKQVTTGMDNKGKCFSKG